MLLLAIALVLFLGLHSIRIFAPAWRQGMIDSVGANAWRGAYSAVSIGSLVLLIYAFAQSRNGTPVIYTPPVFLTHITLTLMLIAMILLTASVLPAGKIAVWVKHPMVLSMTIWAFAHLLANGELNAVALFGGFLIWGVLVRLSLKRRHAAGETALRPFVSVKYDIAAVVIGAAVYAAFLMGLHEWLIGVSPLAAVGM